MKQLYIYLATAVALLLLPGGTDAAKLAPAQLVYVQTEGQTVTVRTDMGNMGLGENLEEAFADLERTTPGKIFLDTADYLLVDSESTKLLPELKGWLKGNCLVCTSETVKDLPGAAGYLDAHPPGTKLKHCTGENVLLQVLTEIEERFCLI